MHGLYFTCRTTIFSNTSNSQRHLSYEGHKPKLQIRKTNEMVIIQKMLTLQKVMTQPFSSYIIVENNVILYYTHTFGEIGQLNPSQSAPLLSYMNYQNIIFTLLEDSSTPYNVYYCRSNGTSLPYKNIWIEDLIHELRTGTMLMDFGTNLLRKCDEKGTNKIFKILQNASLRQKISTLIASDFIQLLSQSPEIGQTSLSRVISKIWSSASDLSRIRYHDQSGSKSGGSYSNSNPIIYGNEHFLENFFSTTLNWFEKQPVTIEMEQMNRVSTRISFCIPFKEHISSLMSYRLINHYFQYIAAYFNFRVYLTQSTLNFIMPVLLRY